jgi:[ribosomal protein S5]-alanine N-acetyltransferase
MSSSMSLQKEIRWPRSIPRLTTERLVLRALTPEDCEDYFKLNADPRVMETYGISVHKKKAQTLNLIRFLHEQFKARMFLRWGIFVKETGQLIGDIGYWRFVDLRARGEIGSKLSPNFWGQGFGTEAVEAVAEYSFQKLNLQSIEGNADVQNLGSIAMLKKVGFIEIGVIPRSSYSDTTQSYVDTLLLHLDCHLWKEGQTRRPKKSKR